MTCQDLLASDFKMAPRVKSMLKHGQLVFEFIKKAKNGVLAQVATNVAVAELMTVEPNLVKKTAKPDKFVLLLSRCIRSLLGWFRDYRRGRYRRQVLRRASPCEKDFLESVIQDLELKNWEDLQVSNEG